VDEANRPYLDGLLLGFSASTAIGDSTSLFVRYEGTISGNDSSQALSLGVRMTWSARANNSGATH